MSAEFFPRAEYAGRLARSVLSNSPVSSSKSGIFLAAPRRTGKSTFVKEDLRKKLVADGAVVIYADLWADKAHDPADVIGNSIRAELARHESVVLRLAKTLGLDEATVAGVKFDLKQVGVAKGITLADALAALSDAVRKPIVFILDEAQHALTTEAGDNSLFALKAARDKLNGSEHHGLRIVATGSNREKLAMLKNSKDQAFFGARLLEFEPLGEDFVEWFCRHAQFGEAVDAKAVYALFQRAGYRPEILFNAGENVSLTRKGQESVLARLQAEVEQEVVRADQELAPVVRSLTPIQRAVLSVMVEMDKAYAPFEAATMARYQAKLEDQQDRDVKANTGSVQQALAALKDKSLVWQAHRGVYALEDPAIARILQLKADQPQESTGGPGMSGD